jgi:hypothetical protein
VYSSDLPEVFAAQIVFWVLLPFVIFAPPRWAVLAWLVMGNLDATGPGQSASDAMGWINASKGVIIPLYLWWRLRNLPGQVSTTLPARLWLILTIHAAVAALWAPFPLAAVKLVGNMIGILLMLIVLDRCARGGMLDKRVIVMLIVASLALGVVQTFYYGGAAYGFDGSGQPTRFSAFVAAQQYAAFLVAFLAAILWQPEIGAWLRVTLGAAIGVGLILNGSRTWFFGATLVLLVYLCLSFRRVAVFAAFGTATAALCSLLLLNLSPMHADVLGDTSSRIVATVNALATGEDTSHNVGLANLNFRLSIYQGAIDDIRVGNTWEFLIGHGTTSGGNVILRVFPASYKPDRLDPNRAIHNEWLRAFYEWGVIGLGLLIATFATLIAGLIRLHRKSSWKESTSAVLSFLPAFLIAFSTENVLAGAGNAVTMSLAVIIALLWTPRPRSTIAR